jgi:hypothetical protein
MLIKVCVYLSTWSAKEAKLESLSLPDKVVGEGVGEDVKLVSLYLLDQVVSRVVSEED